MVVFWRKVFVVLTAALHFARAETDQQNTGNFTIVGGQVFTPGLAIVDAPLPFASEGGGESLHPFQEANSASGR